MSNYWATRNIVERENLLNHFIGATEKELVKQYRRSYAAIEKEMIGLYDEMRADSISDLYSFNRYYTMLNFIQERLTQLGIKEQSIFSKQFTDLYNRNADLIGSQIDFVIGLDEQAARKVIEKIWCADGLHWSDRIWKHKTALVDRLEKGLIDCVSRGASHDEVVKQIQSDFTVGFAAADRVVRTELSYVQNQSTLDKYKQAGISKFQFLAEQGERTCGKCSELNGNQYDIGSAAVGVNMPPLHPNCRCTILAVLEEE